MRKPKPSSKCFPIVAERITRREPPLSHPSGEMRVYHFDGYCKECGERVCFHGLESEREGLNFWHRMTERTCDCLLR